MDEALPVHHDANVVAARRDAEEDEVSRALAFAR